MSKVFFTADHHFCHLGIISLCHRPFAALDEMHQVLIAQWNATVGADDVVWHLGDFAHRASDEHQLRSIFSKLNGQKHLVRGNHDSALTLSLPWQSVTQIAEIVAEKRRLVLCHYPMSAWPGKERGVAHLFGHMHGRYGGSELSLDVGVDAWNYTPVSVAQIQAQLARQKMEDPILESDADWGGKRPAP